MKYLAIALIVLFGFAIDAAILACGVWLTFFLGHSYWWWAMVLMLSWGQTIGTYKFVNAVNGAILDPVG